MSSQCLYSLPHCCDLVEGPEKMSDSDYMFECFPYPKHLSWRSLSPTRHKLDGPWFGFRPLYKLMLRLEELNQSDCASLLVPATSFERKEDAKVFDAGG